MGASMVPHAPRKNTHSQGSPVTTSGRAAALPAWGTDAPPAPPAAAGPPSVMASMASAAVSSPAERESEEPREGACTSRRPTHRAAETSLPQAPLSALPPLSPAACPAGGSSRRNTSKLAGRASKGFPPSAGALSSCSAPWRSAAPAGTAGRRRGGRSAACAPAACCFAAHVQSLSIVWWPEARLQPEKPTCCRRAVPRRRRRLLVQRRQQHDAARPPHRPPPAAQVVAQEEVAQHAAGAGVGAVSMKRDVGGDPPAGRVPRHLPAVGQQTTNVCLCMAAGRSSPRSLAQSAWLAARRSAALAPVTPPSSSGSGSGSPPTSCAATQHPSRLRCALYHRPSSSPLTGCTLQQLGRQPGRPR